jgi:hypothetical protein
MDNLNHRGAPVLMAVVLCGTEAKWASAVCNAAAELRAGKCVLAVPFEFTHYISLLHQF